MDKKKYIEILSSEAEKNGRPQESALDDFLDYVIDYFDLKSLQSGMDSYGNHILEQMRKSHGFFNLVIMWLQDVAKAMERGEWLDVFGILYEEMYLSRGKASRTGQFFTPQCVSDLMAQVIDTGKECGTVNDCASGSGRLLLAHYISKSRTDHYAGRRFKYVAQDCDPIACKMCACNMMAHGMYGMVICQNTLTMSVPSVVYYINEAKYPFDTPYCSIRAVRNEKA